MDNTKCYTKVCSKIGLAMILFYSFFTLSNAAVLVFGEALQGAKNKFLNEVILEILFLVVYFLSFSAAAFILRKTCKGLPSHKPIYTSFNIKKWVLPAIIAVIAMNFALSFVNAIMISSLSPSFASKLSSPSDMTGRPMQEIVVLFIISIISTAVVPAISEEYLFRGGVLTELLPFGKTTAILASSFLFGLMHQNPLQFLYTMLMGIIIGYVYVKTKSIWACVLLHFLNNLVSVLEEYLPLLTKTDWTVYVLDLCIVIFGTVAVIVLLVKNNKQPSAEIDQNGSFGVIYERGMDSEELELELPKGQKLRKFFSRTVIIFIIVCMLSVVGTVLSLIGLDIMPTV